MQNLIINDSQFESLEIFATQLTINLSIDFLDNQSLVKKLDNLFKEKEISRIIVNSVGEQKYSFYGKIITLLLRINRLDIELALIDLSSNKNKITTLFNKTNWQHAFLNSSYKTPLIRDEYGYAIYHSAALVPYKTRFKSKVIGESYIDNHRLFLGEMPTLLIGTLAKSPGIKAKIQRTVWKNYTSTWYLGRAIQTGCTAMLIVRDKEVYPQIRKKCTFYRHQTDLLLVIP